MRNIIARHLRTLTDFRGRETRSEFWPYVGLVLAASTIAMMAGSLVLMFTARDLLHPDQSIIWMSVVTIVAIASLAAAVARRLHDRGLSGGWGLLPLPFLALGLYEMRREFLAFEIQGQDTAFSAAFALASLYDIALIVLIVLLVGRSDEADNRFGPAPDVR